MKDLTGFVRPSPPLLRIAASLLVLGFSVAGCATTQKKIETAIANYNRLPPAKAFAIARDRDGGAAWGWSHSQRTEEDAIRLAIAGCRSQLPIHMIESECLLYAVNGDIVYRSSSTRSIPRPRAERSVGTCFAVSPEGVLLTSHHIVSNARSVRVSFVDGREFPATVEAASEAIDVVVLRIAGATPEYLSLAEPGSVTPGTHVFTMGFPAPDVLGSEPKYSEGSISALSGPGRERTLLQMSVPVQPGNSGGPLVDDKGDVVGIVTSTAAAIPFFRATGSLPQNVNWAVNVDFARPLLPIPQERGPAIQRQDAVERVRRSICAVNAVLTPR